MSGARSSILFAAREFLEEGWIYRKGGGVQLLTRKESGCLWRSRGRHNQRFSDSHLARKIRLLRDHGQSKKYFHDIEGYNGRMDAIQAGILGVKLRYLGEWNEKRRALALRYKEVLNNVNGLLLPYEPSWSKSVYHLYVVRTKKREEIQKYLTDAQIGTALHYPSPLHLQAAYSSMGYHKGDFPNTENSASEIISLPMYPRLDSNQQDKIAQKLAECSLSHCT